MATQNPILIDIPMPIVTPRLIIRPASPGDGHVLHQAKMETIDDLLLWMPWAKKDEQVEDSEIVVREAYAKFIRREDMMLFAFSRATGELVVSTGLHRFDWKAGIFEIGYWTRKSFHNQGYATETSNALTRYAFNELAAKRVEIFHAEGNEASGSVPKKLGFIYEGKNDLATSLPDGTAVAKHVYARFDLNNLPELEVTWS